MSVIMGKMLDMTGSFPAAFTRETWQPRPLTHSALASSLKAASRLELRPSPPVAERDRKDPRPLTHSALASSLKAASRLELRPSPPVGERDRKGRRPSW